MFSLCGRLPRPMAIGCLKHRHAQDAGTPVRLRNGTELRVPQGASLIACPPCIHYAHTVAQRRDRSDTSHAHFLPRAPAGDSGSLCPAPHLTTWLVPCVDRHALSWLCQMCACALPRTFSARPAPRLSRAQHAASEQTVIAPGPRVSIPSTSGTGLKSPSLRRSTRTSARTERGLTAALRQPMK